MPDMLDSLQDWPVTRVTQEFIYLPHGASALWEACQNRHAKCKISSQSSSGGGLSWFWSEVKQSTFKSSFNFLITTLIYSGADFFPLSSCSFYTVNEVHKFQYSKPVRKGEKDPDNEFAVIGAHWLFNLRVCIRTLEFTLSMCAFLGSNSWF